MAIQFIASRRPGKPVTWYIYAWKRGPLIRKHVGARKPVLTASDHAAAAAALAESRAPDPALLRTALREWCPVDPRRPGSPEWNRLADSTKRVWRGHVDRIDARWGEIPLAAWNDPRAVAKVVAWRDSRADTPRSADIGVTVLAAFLEYARLRGKVAINAARDIPTLYRGGDRAAIVWTDDDIAAFEQAAWEANQPHLIDGLQLAAVTGLRREDLVALTWSQVGELAIVRTALKRSRGRRRRVVIPRTPQLEAVLDELRSRPRTDGVDTVLVNSLGRPWTGDGFGGSFNRIRDAAGIAHRPDDGPARKKHLHDLRGTFCTMLLTEWELTDQEAADIMGWSPERVGHIRKVYVDHATVVVALAGRIAAKQKAKQSARQ